MRTYRNCKTIEFVWHGEWADPELKVDNFIANYWDIEEPLWQDFLSDTGHSNAESYTPEVEAEFNEYVAKHEKEVRDLIFMTGTKITE